MTYAYTEITQPINHIHDLITLEENGQLAIPIHCIVDARSVYDALVAPDIRPPTESSLILILKQLKEAMCTFTLKALWWIDTRDMVADGLNKGIISRSALLQVTAEGFWQLAYECRRHQELKRIKLNDQELMTETARSLIRGRSSSRAKA